jgi:hypothetical protein
MREPRKKVKKDKFHGKNIQKALGELLGHYPKDKMSSLNYLLLQKLCLQI